MHPAAHSAVKLHESPICFTVVPQTPPEHDCPGPHCAQTEPFAPHENCELPGEQRPF